MELIVISIISIIISGIFTYMIDDLLTRKHKFNLIWLPIVDGIIYATIYTILVIIFILGI